MSNIAQFKAREILDSRGNPTVEVRVTLSDGAWGRAAVPSGASTGSGEAAELRDGDSSRYRGRGVLKAVRSVDEEIAPALIGRPAVDQQEIDRLLVDLDGTPDKRRLGANAVLGASLAVAHAAAHSLKTPLYAYLNEGESPVLPTPMLNIINGGSHAEDSTDIQEFMVVPAGFETFAEALRAGVEVYHALRDLLHSRGVGTAVGDEGGFVPRVSSDQEAVEYVVDAIDKAGYRPGVDCFIALDVAASEFFDEPSGLYSPPRDGSRLSAQEMIDRLERWVDAYPIISIEDGLDEEDWDGWCELTKRLGHRTQLVGDDLYITSPDRIRKGIELGASNAVLIKPNQIGTLTETLEAVKVAKAAGWGTTISHRSGDTDDTTIADLAVATSAGQIKTGAPARGERTSKYNRLLDIELELGKKAVFAGRTVYERYAL